MSLMMKTLIIRICKRYRNISYYVGSINMFFKCHGIITNHQEDPSPKTCNAIFLESLILLLK